MISWVEALDHDALGVVVAAGVELDLLPVPPAEISGPDLERWVAGWLAAAAEEGDLLDVIDDEIDWHIDRAGSYSEYPDLWMLSRTGEVAWSKQVQIMRAVAGHRKVAVHSAYGTGKSFLAARTACWWIDTHAPGDAFVVTTAPTGAQVRAILWREIRHAASRARARGRPLPGKLNQTEWQIDGELVAFGRKPAEHDAAAFQGIHARHVLVILDEAAGVPQSLWEDAEKLVTTPGSRILAIGNPDREGSHWARTCADPDWHTIHISALATPAFTDEGRRLPPHVVEMLTSPTWVEEQRRKYGEDSPRFQAHVLGVFPKDAAVTTVPLPMAQACIWTPDGRPEARSGVRPPFAAGATRRLGLDVGGGGDWTRVRMWEGNRAGPMWSAMTSDPQSLVRLVVKAVRESSASEVWYDSIGWGFGVPLAASELPDVRFVGVSVAEESSVIDPTSCKRPGCTHVDYRCEGRPLFYGLRDELWWAARECCMMQVDDRYRPIVPYAFAWDLTALEWDERTGRPPTQDDPTLIELTTPSYEDVQRGQHRVIKVESKDSLRKAARLGGSTDGADALLLAALAPRALAFRAGRTPPAKEMGGLAAFGIGGQTATPTQGAAGAVLSGGGPTGAGPARAGVAAPLSAAERMLRGG